MNTKLVLIYYNKVVEKTLAVRYDINFSDDIDIMEYVCKIMKPQLKEDRLIRVIKYVSTEPNFAVRSWTLLEKYELYLALNGREFGLELEDYETREVVYDNVNVTNDIPMKSLVLTSCIVVWDEDNMLPDGVIELNGTIRTIEHNFELELVDKILQLQTEVNEFRR